MAASLRVDADLRFEARIPGHPPVSGRLHGTRNGLALRLDQPAAFARTADRSTIRNLAAILAARGITMAVVTEDTTLLQVGAVRSTWWSRLVTGSPHLRVVGTRGAWTGIRGRLHRTREPVLPTARLLPAPVLLPLAPTFLRRPPGPVTTTHDAQRGGRPRLDVATNSPSVEGQRRFWLRGERVTIGSDPACDIQIPHLQPVHAEIWHTEDDEYIVRDPGTKSTEPDEGPGRGRILRTGARIDLGETMLIFARDEYADHGRPHAGRIGGELGQQRLQPPRPQPHDHSLPTRAAHEPE